ncbi:MAG TPA: tetratricopeptide repeat protein [Polyangiaceae bacterium]
MGDASLFEIAVRFHRAGQVERAELLYRRVIEQAPEHGGAMFLLSVLKLGADRLEEACALLERAVRVAPDNACFLSSLGGVYGRLGRNREAIFVLLMAIARKPEFAEAVVTLALTFEALGELPAAVACYEHARELKPSLSQAVDRLASVKARLNALVAMVPRAPGTELDMSPAELLSGLGAALRNAGAADHAAAWYRAALKLNPRSAYVHTALGAIHADAGRFDQAIVDFQRALAIDECFHPARGYLDTALEQTGRYAELEAVQRNAVALRPDDPNAHSVLLFNMQFWPNVSASDLIAEAQLWNVRHARPLVQALSHRNERSPERRLRIGYVSPNFNDHVLSRFTIPVLQNHDHRQFEIFCYSSVDKPSPETAILRGCADVWREVAVLGDAALSELIRRDQIDILVDLTMHMIGHRLLAFARRPAPVQICWAYPGTTGLETMDYRLSDPFLDPEDESTDYRRAYSEETLRLPDCFGCYDPLTDVPEVSPLPALTAGRITFGCLNHFRKVNDGVLRLWAQVLNAVPESRLTLLAPEGSARGRLRAFFEAAGISSDRLEFVGRCARLDYLSRYREIDICLDTFPYNGHTTSLDALWMGVPTVTLAGGTVVGRAGVCQAMNLGLPDLIATTPAEYVRAASSLANDLEHLSGLRRTLRARLQHSPLMDGARFARNLESVYRDVWRRFCQKNRS